MKYCTHCGKELLDEAVICTGCGCSTGYSANRNSNGLITAAKVFMVISCISSVLCAICGLIASAYTPAEVLLIFPAFWIIPMTIVFFNNLSQKKPISTAFKVCIMIFVSFLAGIFLLCVNEE